MNKFQTGQKWLRSDGKVCVLIEVEKNWIFDQDHICYYGDGTHPYGYNLVSRVASDDEAVEAFCDDIMRYQNSHDKATITLLLSTLRIVSNRLCKQSDLLTELKQLISDSGEKGAAMIKKIEEL